MVATPDFIAAARPSTDPLVMRVRVGAAVCAAGQRARTALRCLLADLHRAARLRLMPAPARRLLHLHTRLQRPLVSELPDRIDALLELADDIGDAVEAVGLGDVRKRQLARRAAALRSALLVQEAFAA